MAGVNHAVWADFKYLKTVYPEIEMPAVILNPRIAMGTAILSELRNMPREVRTKFAFPIKVVYPDDFPQHDIRVYDLENRIDWKVIPQEHRHSNGAAGICTHHALGLETIRNAENRSVMIVRSAIMLYLAFLECARTGRWPKKYEDLSHGDAGEQKARRFLQRIRRTS